VSKAKTQVGTKLTNTIKYCKNDIRLSISYISHQSGEKRRKKRKLYQVIELVTGFDEKN
jgi:hypothetical protein